MYNAHGTGDDASDASTRLHMDMADALNILMYAEPLNGSDLGGAVWDLFRAEDSDKIREFLSSHRHLPQTQVDPIHGQQIYMTDKLLKELWTKQGVKGFRVYQRAGEAIMIPAGCAHQVC